MKTCPYCSKPMTANELLQKLIDLVEEITNDGSEYLYQEEFDKIRRFIKRYEENKKVYKTT